MVELIAGVTYRPGSENEQKIKEALSAGEIPKVPLKTAKHVSHKREDDVQQYLRRHGIASGLTYQSVFVGWHAGTAVEERIVRAYGIPLVVNPALVPELVVASLGDLQNVVAAIGDIEGLEGPPDDRIVNLAAEADPTNALKILVERATAHNSGLHANPRYVEARLYRPWVESDFLRPCGEGDFKIKTSKTVQPGRVRRSV